MVFCIPYTSHNLMFCVKLYFFKIFSSCYIPGNYLKYDTLEFFLIRKRWQFVWVVYRGLFHRSMGLNFIIEFVIVSTM